MYVGPKMIAFGNGIQVEGEDSPLTWREFEEKREQLDAILSCQRESLGSVAYLPRWLYRGQSNSAWALETTLERYVREKAISSKNLTVNEFIRKINATVPAVNSLTKTKFSKIKISEIDENSMERIGGGHSLLYHLRHLGFPSPLLDWSESFLVAAFFAFQRAPVGQDVAIFAMNLGLEGYRIRTRGQPHILDFGHYVETHPRHYMQQSSYSICFQMTDGILTISPHEKAAEINPRYHTIFKFIISADERLAVMEKLHASNINAYTLFGSDESLMDTLAYREFVRPKP